MEQPATSPRLHSCCEAIDNSSPGVNKVAANCRSRMNIPFFLRDETRNDAFLAGAKQRGLLQPQRAIKSVGGMRASIYNAMPWLACRRWSTTCENLSSSTPDPRTLQ